jgi:hypothetical protein
MRSIGCLASPLSVVESHVFPRHHQTIEIGTPCIIEVCVNSLSRTQVVNLCLRTYAAGIRKSARPLEPKTKAIQTPFQPCTLHLLYIYFVSFTSFTNLCKDTHVGEALFFHLKAIYELIRIKVSKHITHRRSCYDSTSPCYIGYYSVFLNTTVVIAIQRQGDTPSAAIGGRRRSNSSDLALQRVW